MGTRGRAEHALVSRGKSRGRAARDGVGGTATMLMLNGTASDRNADSADFSLLFLVPRPGQNGPAVALRSMPFLNAGGRAKNAPLRYLCAGWRTFPMADRPYGRGPARFREREVARVVRAARQAGGVERIEIASDGTIHVVLAKGCEATQAGDDDSSEWDEALDRGKR